MSWIRWLRLKLGRETEDDRRRRHKEMLQAVQNYMNELDRKDADKTPVERPRR